MTKDHLINRLMELLPLALFLVGCFHQCNGQNGGNFFYYYSPTQRTHSGHGIASAPGQFFNNPFFSQQSPTPAPQQDDGQPKQGQLNLPFPTMAPQFQSTVLGYHQPHFQSHMYPTAAPPAHLQYPLITPTPVPVSPAFNTYTRFGNQAHLLGQFPHTPQPSFVTQPPIGTVAPGSFNFFNNPFQYLHERIIQSAPTPETPMATSTAMPTPAPPSPAPESDADVVDAAPVVTRRPKISSRFRYVQPVQYNPYSQLGSPYTSDLPYTEQRFYSSPTNPTGYAFSLGGDNGSGSTSTVHFSLGPLSNIQQYHKEITNTRRKLQRQQIEEATPTAPAPPANPVSEMTMNHDAPAQAAPEQPSTTTTVAPPSSTTTPAQHTPETMPNAEAAPLPEQVTPEAMNSTLEPLLNEPSFRSETIAAPASSAVPDISTKLSEINIPRRLVIRKKVARKRLGLNGLPEDSTVAQVMPNGVMIKRIASQNRLPVEEQKDYENPDSLKGPAVNSIPEVVTPSTTTTTTTESAAQMPSEETPVVDPGQSANDGPRVMTLGTEPLNHPVNDEYYEEYEEENPSQSLSNNPGKVMSAVMASESDRDLPILAGVSKEDFPTVFKHSGDNSVETDQGVVINRVSVSQPTVEETAENIPPPSPATPSTTTTTTTEATFMRDDPLDEEPPMDSEEPAPPVFQPMSSTTTTEVAMPMSTTTASPLVSSPASLSENMSDELDSEMKQDDEVKPMPVPPQPEAPVESAMELSSTTRTLELPVENLSSTAESIPNIMPKHEDMSDEEPMMVDPNVSSTTETMMSSSTTEDVPMLPEMEFSAMSSTEGNIVASSTNDVAPLSPTTESAPSSTEESKDIDFPLSSEEGHDDGEHPGETDVESDSAEIGKAQRLALEESLRRIRERQQTSSTTDSTNNADSSPDNEIQNGRRVFSRKPFQISNLSLPTSGSAPRVNVVLDEEDGVDRNQVIEKIQRFRQSSRVTTTKRPRRVTRPSPATEGRIPVVVPVDDLLGREVQVDSYSDSSSTPGPVIEPATTNPPIIPPYYPHRRTTTTTTTTPEESSTTQPTFTDDILSHDDSSSTTSSTESFTTTTPLPRMLTKMTDNQISSTTPTSDEFSSTTETDYEQAFQAEPESSTTTSTTTEIPMMTTTPAIMTMTTMPSRKVTPEIDTSAETDSMTVNDDDIVYEDNVKSAPPKVQVSSTEVPSSSTEAPASSIEAEMMDGPSSSTTIPPPSSTDPVYTYLTTPEPFSMGTTTVSTTETFSSTTMTTTPAGQLIIHEILPTMPPLKQVRFVIGDSVEDDQSSAVGPSQSDELLNADKAIVRVETNVHVVTNGTTTDSDSASAEVSQEVANQLTNASVESGEGSQRRVRVVVRRQRRLRRPTTEGSPQQSGERRRRRRKVLKRHH